ncbi:MAG: T9SS type A sorting domain-containing protein, partial [Bacteroidetes bacterium]|nr:T9SS type A sorting domain-containing protein [Bacteroidota bacterium]
RRGITPATDYHYKPTQYPVQVRWPLPENFAYTQPANLLTAGTDGLPLGDLNWFPTAKAQFEANKAQYIAQLQDLAGPRIVITPVADYECENGVLSGTATIKTFSGFAYFQMDGGGWIQWDFDLAQAGQYDLNIWTHLRGNSMRGQRIIVNGTSIHDPKGWGEYIWAPDEVGHPTYGMPKNEWTWTKIRQSEILEPGALTLRAGRNTIRIESSWGWQNFAGIDVIPAGQTTPAVQLRAWDATYEIVQLKAEGAPWVPSKFKSVALGPNGTVTLSINAATAGNYLFALYYQNGSASAKTIWYKVDNGSAVEMLLPGRTDSAGLTKTSNVFPLTVGTHTITIGGGDGVNVDYIKLNKQEMVTDVESVNLPYTFSLEQNYPNPFNPATTINFTIGKSSNVKLVVYNLLGQKVATLVDTRMDAGQHTIIFDGAHLASGVYFYKLEAGDFRAVKKMLLLK